MKNSRMRAMKQEEKTKERFIGSRKIDGKQDRVKYALANDVACIKRRMGFVCSF